MFIVIEKHGGYEYASIVIDKEGNNKVFDTIEEAQEEADELQDGIVVGDKPDIGVEEIVFSKFNAIKPEKLRKIDYSFDEVIVMLNMLKNKLE